MGGFPGGKTCFGGKIWRSPVAYATALAGTALAYFILAKLGLRFALINPSVSPIWPATGLGLAAVLLFGQRIWPAIFVGGFAADATTSGGLATAFFIAIGSTLEAMLGGLMIERWSQGCDTFTTPARVAKFALVSVGPATVVGATIGISALCATGFASWHSFGPIWTTWWLGDAAGALVLTPVVVLWAHNDSKGFDRRELLLLAATLGFAVIIGLIAFSPLLSRSKYTVPLAFLAILPLVWAALGRRPRDTASVSLIMTAFAVWATVEQSGPFAQRGINESFLVLLTFMISLSVPSLVLSADVAVRRRTEESLRRAQEALDRRVKERTAELADANIYLLEAQRLANLGSWVWDLEQNKVSWSEQLREIYGVTAEEAPSRVEDFLQLVDPDDRPRVQARVTAALESGHEFMHSERILRPDGGVRYLQSRGEVVRDESGRPIRMLGVCLDVTERVKAENALRESEHSLHLLLSGVRDYAIYMLDPTGLVQNWSEGAQRLKRYSAEDVVGRHFSMFLPEEARVAGMAEQALATATRDGQFEAQTWLLRKDGSRFYASVVMDAIYGEDGALIGFAKFVRDITEQHEAQVALEETREQLAQAQKMEALGQLTGGIAHDFNNLLMIVSGYAQILQRRLTDAKDAQAIEAIRAATSRGERLTRQLLTFSRRQRLTPVVVDLRTRIDAVREMLAPSLHGNIRFVASIEDELWPVEVDLGEFELALLNVAVNARDAMADGGTLTLEARNLVLRRGSAAGSLEGDFVALKVVDTGCGIPPEALTRVFEPFFTTKPVGKGTGLGLSQVHGFANQSGGAVTVTSEEGKGTAVTIYLPRSLGTLPAEGGSGAVPVAGKAQGTVLVVEDSREVAAVTAAMVEQLGFRVIRAENAEEALRHLQQGVPVDLVFSDIVMPGTMNGIALGSTCRERFPELPVLLTTGFTDAAQGADERFEILRKPFELSALERAIETALQNRNREPTAKAG